MEISKEKLSQLQALIEGKKCPFCGGEYKIKANAYLLMGMPNPMKPQQGGLTGDPLAAAVCSGCRHVETFRLS